MSWAVHESGPAVVVRITGVRALRLTPEEARALAVALLVAAESPNLSSALDTSAAKGQACP